MNSYSSLGYDGSDTLKKNEAWMAVLSTAMTVCADGSLAMMVGLKPQNMRLDDWAFAEALADDTP